MMHNVCVGLAAALVAVAGCGGDDGGGAAVDAPVAIDATTDAEVAIDAMPIDAVPAPVTVLVDTAVGPFAGTLVVFLDNNDQVVSSTTTDATGQAIAMLPTGGKVAAAFANAPSEGFLWLGVEPGDVLRLSAGQGASPPQRTATITVPALSGATMYEITSECGSGGSATTSVMFNFRDAAGCGSQDLLVRGYTSAAMVSFYLAAQTLSDGATLNLSSGGTYAARVDRTVAMTGVPGTVTRVDFRGSLVESDHLVGPERSTDGVPTSGTVSSSIAFDPVAGARLFLHSELDDGPIRVTMQRLGAQTAGTFDHAALRTRDPVSSSYASATLTWTESGTGVAPQGAYIEMIYGAPAFWHGGNNIRWRVLGTGIASARIPALPAALAHLNVAGRPFGSHIVTLFHHASGGATVRQRAFGARAELDLLPADATFVTSRRSFGAL